jgi:endonuclease/exonuclease/phosphatase (EEP) superfamily protein YafD
MALRDIPDEKLFIILRRLPQLIIFISLLLLIGMNSRVWLLEQFISLLPQVMIIVAGLFMLLFTFYGRFIIRDGWHRCKIILGKRDILSVSLSIFITSIVLFNSFIVTKPLKTEFGSGQIFNIATFNKFIDSKDVQQVIEYFKVRRPDVISLQEIHFLEAEEIQRQLGFDYIYSSNCNCSAEDSDVIIVSRYPIDNPSVIYEHPTGAIVRGEIKISNKSIAFYAVHIPPPYTPESYNRRHDMYDRLIDTINGENLPVVLAGDFNTTVFSYDYKHLTNQLDEHIKNVTVRAWPKCTWHGFGDGLCLRIDHIFIPQTATLKDFDIGRNASSDHRPVWASIQF